METRNNVELKLHCESMPSPFLFTVVMGDASERNGNGGKVKDVVTDNLIAEDELHEKVIVIGKVIEHGAGRSEIIDNINEEIIYNFFYNEVECVLT